MDDHQFLREMQMRNAEIKADLQRAKPEDFRVVKVEHGSGDITWAASLYGCTDIAWFRRKQDCEKFIRNWSKD